MGNAAESWQKGLIRRGKGTQLSLQSQGRQAGRGRRRPEPARDGDRLIGVPLQRAGAPEIPPAPGGRLPAWDPTLGPHPLSCFLLLAQCIQYGIQVGPGLPFACRRTTSDRVKRLGTPSPKRMPSSWRSRPQMCFLTPEIGVSVSRGAGVAHF